MRAAPQSCTSTLSDEPSPRPTCVRARRRGPPPQRLADHQLSYSQRLSSYSTVWSLTPAGNFRAPIHAARASRPRRSGGVCAVPRAAMGGVASRGLALQQWVRRACGLRCDAHISRPHRVILASPSIYVPLSCVRQSYRAVQLIISAQHHAPHICGLTPVCCESPASRGSGRDSTVPSAHPPLSPPARVPRSCNTAATPTARARPPTTVQSHAVSDDPRLARTTAAPPSRQNLDAPPKAPSSLLTRPPVPAAAPRRRHRRSRRRRPLRRPRPRRPPSQASASTRR